MFRRKKPQPTPRALPTWPVEYPAGIAVKTDKGTYLINKDGKKYRIQSKQILDSWNFPLLVETTEAALAKHPTAVTKLGFRDGSLLNNISDGRMYLVSGSLLRHIVSVDILSSLGVTPSDFTLVSDADIQIMKRGEQIG